MPIVSRDRWQSKLNFREIKSILCSKQITKLATVGGCCWSPFPLISSLAAAFFSGFPSSPFNQLSPLPSTNCFRSILKPAHPCNAQTAMHCSVTDWLMLIALSSSWRNTLRVHHIRWGGKNVFCLGPWTATRTVPGKWGSNSLKAA